MVVALKISAKAIMMISVGCAASSSASVRTMFSSRNIMSFDAARHIVTMAKMLAIVFMIYPLFFG